MNTFLTAFVFAFGAVVLAEMGDKTQLLAMAFATKFKASKVMMGVFIATILNHALAVAVGHFITRFESINLIIQAFASLSFIFFGLWTIRGDKLEGEENRTTRFGAVITVAVAFFIAEMGDKTQLATIALATKFPASPIAILTGTTIGMLAADGFGIVVGHVLKKKIPEQKIKMFSAGIFIFFGLLGTYEVITNDLGFKLIYTIAIMMLIIISTGISGYLLMKKAK
ncbi:MAG: TMEM165/GDT1 family protein [Synergistaceae bacterium]|jgi:putative Ca2+/H+ antiporter (TMEM165/GDT1 family)|nr:TMEM165/GDT1 family protein [Synergistaceae bacterium]